LRRASPIREGLLMRELLPNRRRNESFEFSHGSMRFTCCCGYYRDSRLAEVFLSSAKPGSAIESLARDSAILVSLCLQHGVGIETIRHAVTRDDTGGPATAIGAALDALIGGAP
jgi:hypothetical protein